MIVIPRELSVLVCVSYNSGIILLGTTAIERAPVNVGVTAGELVTFSCTLNITGNEVLQFQVMGAKFADNQSGCEIDKSSYTQTVCSWPASQTNMTCDYSVPYQIMCDLTLNASSTVNSTQVTCSSSSDERNLNEKADPNVIGKTLTLLRESNFLFECGKKDVGIFAKFVFICVFFKFKG